MSEKMEPLPCPFCGSPHVAVVTFETPHDEIWYRAQCQSCMAKSPGAKFSTLAIAAWNRRSPSVSRDAVIEEAAKVANDYERGVTAFSHGVQRAAEQAARTIASRIRALKGERTEG